MKHTITIQVNGIAFQAHANVHHNNAGRCLESVTADAPLSVTDALEQSALDVNDVLYCTLQYFLLHDKATYSFACGPVDVVCSLDDIESLRTDLHSKTYMVKITDVQNNRHSFDVGAPNAINAFHAVKSALNTPIRNYVCQPVEFI